MGANIIIKKPKYLNRHNKQILKINQCELTITLPLNMHEVKNNNNLLVPFTTCLCRYRPTSHEPIHHIHNTHSIQGQIHGIF